MSMIKFLLPFRLSVVLACISVQSVLVQANVPLIKVLGESGDHVVTSREVEIDVIAESVLYGKQPSKEFEEHLDRVLMEWAVYKEAQSFGVSELSDSEVNTIRGQFSSGLEKSKYKSRWGQLSVTGAELTEVLKRKLRARKFIDFKVGASSFAVTDAEALNYYQKNRREFGRTAFSKVRSRIKDLISHERSQERLNDWYKILERKYSIRKASR